MIGTVEIEPSDFPPDALWRPEAGPATKLFLEGTSLDGPARNAVRERAVSILGACLPPSRNGAGARTGLVVGYVQSGKTQSFTALTALARDAGYPLVVLLAGTKKILHRQTADRLKQDLQKNGGERQWILVENLRAKHPKYARVEKTLRSSTGLTEWSRKARTVVLTVMKNPSSLNKLADVLAAYKVSGALSPDVPILIIDDEADQAGLNASR